MYGHASNQSIAGNTTTDEPPRANNFQTARNHGMRYHKSRGLPIVPLGYEVTRGQSPQWPGKRELGWSNIRSFLPAKEQRKPQSIPDDGGGARPADFKKAL